MGTKGLRNGAIVAFIVSMAFLLIGGHFAKDKVPPIPNAVRHLDYSKLDPASLEHPWEVLTTADAIWRGQTVYQRYGLMDHGSVWGHGTLRGMDFSADTLHRMAQSMRVRWINIGARYLEGKDDRVRMEIRPNHLNADGDLILSYFKTYAFQQNRKYWEQEFGEGDEHYGFLPNTVPTPEERQDVADFFFWTAWAAGTERPGENYTYTNNWPPDRSVGNVPSTEALFWSIGSILSLFAVLGLVVYVVHRYGFFYGEAKAVEASYRLLAAPVTPSQRASAKFLVVAGLLFVVQIFNGGLMAHYTVHPGKFFIEFIGQMYPYSWAKSWHLQLAILWIAVSWIGTATYLAPLVAGREPKRQRLLVNVLFAAAVVVAVGSLFGEVLGIKGWIGDRLWFWLGHQGWEYLELGRLWQILLFGGLIYWLVIVYRVLAPVLAAKSPSAADPGQRSLVWFYVLSAALVVLFFGFGLVYGPSTHLTVADYWRWFVVHIWVESIFEFFGVAIISLFLVTLGLVTAQSALRVAYLTAILVFVSGIPGTAHHYFWYGGPSYWLAVGGLFSSLEPIPLILLVVRAWMEYRSIRTEGKEFPYRWPLYFLTASSVWNFVGAGIFGFMINLPIINYYEHGTYLTANHAHTALFGVYGMLAIALILFAWRGLVENKYWKDGVLKLSFWGLNGGLFLMFLTGLLPIGLMQVWQSYDKGFWFARSAAFYEMNWANDRVPIQELGTWRAAPDAIVILLGALPVLYFLVSTYPRLRKAGGETQP